MSRLAGYRTHAALFAVGLIAFGATAGSRLRRQSQDPHFVYQADAWLHGRLAIEPAPEKGDDWAKLETVELDDGSQVRGRRLTTRRRFRIAGGGEVPLERVKRTVATTHHVGFPPFPAVLMIPQAAVHGRIANDVATTVVVAALALPLAFAALRRLRAAGLSSRTDRDHLWLVAAFAFGSVFYFSAVQGRVWYTAHVVGVALAFLYLWASIEARHPIVAGVALALGAVTRVPLAFAFPLFLLEAWRAAGGRDDLRRFAVLAAKFAAPVAVVAALAMLYNHARFSEPTEFGHSYLWVKQQAQMETIGKFSFRYLSRNLAVALALLPDVTASKPYVSISGHGLAIWFTTPLLLLLLWPRERNRLHRALWITVALVAAPTLLYQNSGWVQFGYRFSLDYLPFLLALIAIGGRPLGRAAQALIVWGVVVNLFGAVTFNRLHQHYRADDAAYRTVIKH